MNCHEFREKIDDYLDFSRQEKASGDIVRHLEHCEACREYLSASKMAHITLFRSLNAAYENNCLPQGFADRLVANVKEHKNAGNAILRLARWPFVAAAVVLVAGFVSAAIGVVNAINLNTGTVCVIEDKKTTEAVSTEGSISGLSGNGVSADALVAKPETAVRKRTASVYSAIETDSLCASLSSASNEEMGLKQMRFENVPPPYGAASSVATSCIELEARSVVRRPTNIIPLRILPCKGLYIVVS